MEHTVRFSVWSSPKVFGDSGKDNYSTKLKRISIIHFSIVHQHMVKLSIGTCLISFFLSIPYILDIYAKKAQGIVENK